MFRLFGVVGSLALGAALLTAGPVQAHGGGLDWQGGHNCNVGSCAGTYHCHQARGGICLNGGQSQSRPQLPPRPNLTNPMQTCVKEQGESERCVFGRSWTSSWCWDLEGAEGPVHLEKKVNGSWQRVESDVADRNAAECGAEYPWETFVQIQETRLGTFNYRLRFSDGDTYGMRVTVR